MLQTASSRFVSNCMSKMIRLSSTGSSGRPSKFSSSDGPVGAADRAFSSSLRHSHSLMHDQPDSGDILLDRIWHVNSLSRGLIHAFLSLCFKRELFAVTSRRYRVCGLGAARLLFHMLRPYFELLRALVYLIENVEDIVEDGMLIASELVVGDDLMQTHLELVYSIECSSKFEIGAIDVFASKGGIGMSYLLSKWAIVGTMQPLRLGCSIGSCKGDDRFCAGHSDIALVFFQRC